MKQLLEVLAEIIGYVAVLAMVLGLFFLFAGEPDLWDALRARAINAACPSTTIQQKQSYTRASSPFRE